MFFIMKNHENHHLVGALEHCLVYHMFHISGIGNVIIPADDIICLYRLFFFQPSASQTVRSSAAPELSRQMVFHREKKM
jgi:hypothetical protein